jgi:hypothetical protein
VYATTERLWGTANAVQQCSSAAEAIAKKALDLESHMINQGTLSLLEQGQYPRALRSSVGNKNARNAFVCNARILCAGAISRQ